MKVEITQENLSKALSSVARVAGGRTTLPVLANILLATENGLLKIAATNLEVAIIQRIGAKIAQEGSFTVPARLLQEYIAALPAGNITLELQDNKLAITAKNCAPSTDGVAAEEFPALPSVQSEQPIELEESAVKTAVSKVIIAASNDDARPILTGAFLHTHEGTLYLAATDSYRLAEHKIAKTSREIAVVIPAKSLSELLRLITDGDDVIEIHDDETQVRFVYGNSELITRLVDGKCPEYRQLIPAESEVSLSISRSEFSNITKVASLFARESAGSITISVDGDEGTVSIRSVAAQVGENTSSAEATIKGSGDVTLNSRFLLDALGAMNADSVSFKISGKIKPCILRPEVDNPEYLHVIMPLRS